MQAKSATMCALLAYVERNERTREALTGDARAHPRPAPAPPPASASGRASSIRPGKPTKAGRIPACSCRSPATIRPIIDVPGHSYSFGVVKAAQARGDLEVLVERGRRALRVHLKDVDAGLTELARAMRSTALE